MANFADGSWCPTLGMQRSDEWRILKAQYGDGYQQRILDGIHNLKRKWSLSWDNRPKEQAVAMLDYLKATKAASFPFKDPATGEVVQVFCDAWSITWNISRQGGEQAWGTIAADFEEAFGLWIAQ